MKAKQGYISGLLEKGLLQKQIEKDRSFLSVSTPCRFHLTAEIVQSLQDAYINNEEIGGLLWAAADMRNSERLFQISKVSYIRNAIAEYPDKGNRTIHDAYWPDPTIYGKEFNLIVESNCLPIHFHSHPCGEELDLSSLIHQLELFETSDQDIKSSKRKFTIEGKDILLPRALVAKSNKLSQDISVGIYDGFVAKEKFKGSVEKVQKENKEKISESLSKIKLSNGGKVALGITGLLLLIAIIKYRKYSLPVIASLAASVPLFLSGTSSVEKPEYFNKVSSGPMDIYIP